MLPLDPPVVGRLVAMLTGACVDGVGASVGITIINGANGGNVGELCWVGACVGVVGLSVGFEGAIGTVVGLGIGGLTGATGVFVGGETFPLELPSEGEIVVGLGTGVTGFSAGLIGDTEG